MALGKVGGMFGIIALLMYINTPDLCIDNK